VGEALDLFGETIAIEPLDGVHDPGMQGAASLVEKALIGDLVREGVLEGVLDLGEQARLVDELGPLKLVEPGPKLILCQIGDGMEQRRRDVLGNDEATCNKRLCSGARRSMRAASTACTVAGTWIVWID